MDLAIAILLCLFFLALIILGEIYLEMDKQRTRAIICIKRMRVNLDKWIEETIALAESSATGRETASDLRSLAHDYFSCKRYKETLKVVSLINSMAAMSAPLEDGAIGTEAGSILIARADYADNIEPLRREYNQCARKLNSRLDKKIPATVGRLLRISKMEELRRLSDA